jgi:hypothetical protein
VVPLASKRQKSEEDIGQQGHPDLPLNRILAMPEEVAQLKDLFDLLEEGFNAPAALVAGKGDCHLMLLSRKEEESKHVCSIPFHSIATPEREPQEIKVK